MKNKKLRVFHGLVNYGTQAGFFSSELRAQGIDAISVASRDKYMRQIDVQLIHGGDLLHKITRYAWDGLRRIYWFFRYNTFHFYYGSSLFPNQWDLPFYKYFGKKVIMEYLGIDVQLYQVSLDKYEITNTRYYKADDNIASLDSKRIKRLLFETKHLNKQLVCAPYISEFVSASEVLPLALDIKRYKYLPIDITKEEIVIMHSPTRRDNKGTSFIIDACNRLVNEGFKIKFLLIENVTHDELKKKYVECDLFIDQILAGWYGTASIEAMAIGRPTICFIRESYYKYIDYGHEIPIINANPRNIYTVLKETILNKHKLPQIGKESRKFVEKIHSLDVVTLKLIEIYKSL